MIIMEMITVVIDKYNWTHGCVQAGKACFKNACDPLGKHPSNSRKLDTIKMGFTKFVIAPIYGVGSVMFGFFNFFLAILTAIVETPVLIVVSFYHGMRHLGRRLWNFRLKPPKGNEFTKQKNNTNPADSPARPLNARERDLCGLPPVKIHSMGYDEYNRADCFGHACHHSKLSQVLFAEDESKEGEEGVIAGSPQNKILANSGAAYSDNALHSASTKPSVR